MVKRKALIVIGLGFGDEGKGLTTDYLCLKNSNSIVVRFNGGQQAGHCVALKNGFKHIFSNFGSGTLRGIPTYWSKYCTFEPLGFIKEYDLLKKYNPQIYIDLNCRVTTHYDILFNRTSEISLGKNCVGSCGLGFRPTIERSNEKDLLLKFEDILSEETCSEKLKKIRTYYRSKINTETYFDFMDFNHDEADIIFLDLVKKIRRLLFNGGIIPVHEEVIFSEKIIWDTFIFEGAQGILLDQNYGTKPHITKSNTTSNNAIEILNRYDFPIENIELYYVTRSYQTRHGAGPFKSRDLTFELQNNLDETNVNNMFQGEFKTNYLDIDDLNYAIKCDQKHSKDVVKNLIVTCLDQLKAEDVIYYANGKLQISHYKELHKSLLCDFKTIKYSFSNCSEDLI